MSLDNVLPPGAVKPLWRRFWTYQAERFPLARHVPLIVAFAWGGVGFGAQVRADGGWPAAGEILVAALVLLIAFFQLRVADEHKDLEDDMRHRPERPVPRGLIQLSELRAIALAGVAVQATAALTLHAPLLALLFLIWAWMGLMTAEFFAPAWLKARPIVYLFSHMGIMPLLALFAVGCGLFPKGGAGGPAVLPFLALALCSGLLIELARKTLAPADERPGVETYSALWGPTRAGMALALASVATLFAAFWANLAAQAHPLLILPTAAAALWLFVTSARYGASPRGGQDKLLVAGSAGVTASAYLCIAIAPLLSAR